MIRAFIDGLPSLRGQTIFFLLLPLEAKDLFPNFGVSFLDVDPLTANLPSSSGESSGKLKRFRSLKMKLCVIDSWNLQF